MATTDDARRQEARKKAGDLLKMADRLFKEGDLDGAGRLIEMAMGVDQDNVYVMAYQERLKLAMEQKEYREPRKGGGREKGKAGTPSAATADPPAKADEPQKKTTASAKSAPDAAPARAAAREPDEAPRVVNETPSGDAQTRLIEDLKRQLEEERAKREETERRLTEVEMSKAVIRRLPDEETLTRLRKELEGDVTRLIGAEYARRVQEERAAGEKSMKAWADAEVDRRVKQEESRFAIERQAMEEAFRLKIEKERAKLEDAKRKAAEEARLTFAGELKRHEQELVKERARLEKDRADLKARVDRLDVLRVKEEGRMEEFRVGLEQEFSRRINDESKKLDAERARLREAMQVEFAAEMRRRVDDERRLVIEERRRHAEEEDEIRRVTEEHLRQKLEEEFQKRLADQREKMETEIRLREDGLPPAPSWIAPEVPDSLPEPPPVETARRVPPPQPVEESPVAASVAPPMSDDEDVRAAIEEGRRRAQARKIQSYMDDARALMDGGHYEESLAELAKAFHLDPEHADARELENTIYAMHAEAQRYTEVTNRALDQQRRTLEELKVRLADHGRQEDEREKLRVQRSKTVREAMQRAEHAYNQGEYDTAVAELESVYAIDPGNSEAQQLEMTVLSMQRSRTDVTTTSQRRIQQGDSWKREELRRQQQLSDEREALRQECMTLYRGMLQRVWTAGKPEGETRTMLDSARATLLLSETDHETLEHDVRVQAYHQALKAAMSADKLRLDDAAALATLRGRYDINPREHAMVESNLAREKASRNR